MRMVDLILRKRAGNALTEEEIRWFVQGFTDGKIPDYQVSALMMAIYFKGMDMEETVHLVQAMIDSGDVIDLSAIRGEKVDKHSTGGVGDKTSIVLGPMVAACGVPVAKLSGRGLGHTGGTLDKLESFSGFQVELTMDQFVRNVNEYGIALVSQTANLVPADKKLYALRDVTGTVENISLIAGSIMSKKLASGAGGIVLDVKTGSGAFMKDEGAARQLAQAMVEIGQRMGRKTVALISDMDQPLGNAVGNALEVKEAIQALKGEGPADLMELCLALGAEMLMVAGNVGSTEEGRAKLEAQIASGAALEKLKDLIQAQGGDPNQVDAPGTLPRAGMEVQIYSPEQGYISRLQADQVGLASMMLGAGRETKDSKINLGAGIWLHAKPGDYLEKGQLLAELHGEDQEQISEAAEALLKAYSFVGQPPAPRPIVLGRID